MGNKVSRAALTRKLNQSLKAENDLLDRAIEAERERDSFSERLAKTTAQLSDANREIESLKSRMHDAHLIVDVLIQEHFPQKDKKRQCGECGTMQYEVTIADEPVARILHRVCDLLRGPSAVDACLAPELGHVAHLRKNLGRM